MATRDSKVWKKEGQCSQVTNGNRLGHLNHVNNDNLTYVIDSMYIVRQ